jgi:hypothetical protein
MTELLKDFAPRDRQVLAAADFHSFSMYPKK